MSPAGSCSYDARLISDAVRQVRTTDAGESVPPAVARALREAIPTLLPYVGRHRDRLNARDQSRQYVNETLARANQWSPDLGRVPLYYLAALAGELLRYAEQAPRPGAVS
ncbi:hypothetical protein ACQEVX_27980 [Streptomyces syringium]|uniref:hypothetical protein n=1 Tax=Streptomyces syringium TaxID=76729 RepID=UPI003D8F9FAD